MFIKVIITIVAKNKCSKYLISISNIASEMVKLLCILMHTRFINRG